MSNSHGAASAATTVYGALARAVVVGAVLRADEPRLGPPFAAERPDPAHRVALLLDPPEEVVRGEEDQPAAEVAEPLDDVVGVRGHVLAVPGEDDEVVERAEVVARGERLEVVLGDHVRQPCPSAAASAGRPGRTP